MTVLPLSLFSIPFLARRLFMSPTVLCTLLAVSYTHTPRRCAAPAFASASSTKHSPGARCCSTAPLHPLSPLRSCFRLDRSKLGSPPCPRRQPQRMLIMSCRRRQASPPHPLLPLRPPSLPPHMLLRWWKCRLRSQSIRQQSPRLIPPLPSPPLPPQQQPHQQHQQQHSLLKNPLNTLPWICRAQQR
jgi:hypothetical protein